MKRRGSAEWGADGFVEKAVRKKREKVRKGKRKGKFLRKLLGI